MIWSSSEYGGSHCDGLNWRVRHARSWSTAWCSFARRTRWSRRCCMAGGGTRGGVGWGWSPSSPGGVRGGPGEPRARLVRRFQVFTNELPSQWGPGDMDDWTLSLTSEAHLAPSTIRGYQTVLRLFSAYLTDARYGWAVACEEAFGTFPVQICNEWNTIAHRNDYEGSPEARPLSRQELQRFLDYADDQVERAATSRRKGALAAYRDATLFKVIYGWGLRRTEASKLDLLD